MEEVLVEAGLVNLALILGLLIGLCLAGITLLSIKFAYRNGFKHYLEELEVPEDRRVVEEAVSVVSEKVTFLAQRTNTKLFKQLHNDLNELKTTVKRKWLNS